VTPEGLQRGGLRRCVPVQRVPDLSSSNRKSSATDGRKSSWRHHQPLGSSRTL